MADRTIAQEIDALRDRLAGMGIVLSAITLSTYEQREALAHQLWRDAGCPQTWKMQDEAGSPCFSYNGVFLRHG